MKPQITKWIVRASVALLAAAVLAGVAFALVERAAVPEREEVAEPRRIVAVEDELIPPHREPSPSPSPSPEAPPPPPPKPKPRPKPVRVVNLDVYKGLGAWVDIYDVELEPADVIDELSRRSVKTLYLETNNFRSGTPPGCSYGPDVDILYPEEVSQYLDLAHRKGINVVAWYLPGFADMDRDIRRSLGAINFKTAAGNTFDGFAPDIESRGEFGCKGVPSADQRTAFNNGIVEYSKRLGEAVGTDKVIGGIVVDAKNNERAPSRWAGFPWPDIAKSYDIVMPMAYWSADPRNGGCGGADIDTNDYMQQVVAKTEALMGTKKPMHLIGGVVDCVSAAEVRGYVDGMKAVGSLGASLYDYKTTQRSPERDSIWSELLRFAQ